MFLIGKGKTVAARGTIHVYFHTDEVENNIQDRGCKELARMRLPNLKELDLGTP